MGPPSLCRCGFFTPFDTITTVRKIGCQKLGVASLQGAAACHRAGAAVNRAFRRGCATKIVMISRVRTDRPTQCTSSSCTKFSADSVCSVAHPNPVRIRLNWVMRARAFGRRRHGLNGPAARHGWQAAACAAGAVAALESTLTLLAVSSAATCGVGVCLVASCPTPAWPPPRLP